MTAPMTLLVLSALVPLLMLAAALIAFSGPGLRPHRQLRLIQALALIAFLLSAGLTLAVFLAAPIQGQMMGESWWTFGLLVDRVSLPVLTLVSGVGLMVLNFSRRALDGEARQGPFFGWVALTLASVECLILSGTLVLFAAAFIATSLSFQNLLIFYPDRPGVRRLARKKFFFARLADLSLLGGFVLLYRETGTADIATLLTLAKTGQFAMLSPLPVLLIAVAALVKSTQFPFHVWLPDVMEAPTPVSALLHAGIINAGGFVLIRFADIMLLSPAALSLLVVIGGFTALLGSLVLLTQTSIKAALTWSTIAQMGFMILQCGFGLFSIALLHILAHSLYKAHAFLGSGSAIGDITLVRRAGPVAMPSTRDMAVAFTFAVLTYAGVGALFGIWHKAPQLLALGVMLISGVGYMMAQATASTAPTALGWRLLTAATALAIGYFTFQQIALHVMVDALPQPPALGPFGIALMSLTVISFILVAIFQTLLPRLQQRPAVRIIRLHLAEGLYFGTLWDRVLGNFSPVTPVNNRI